MEIIYREIDKDSFDEIRYFMITHEFSWRDSDPKGFIARTEEQRDDVANRYLERLSDGNERYYCLGAFDGDELIGSHFLDRYKIDGKEACHVHGLWTDSRHRGKGIAYQLKELGEAWAKSKGCVLMDSNVKVTNESMIALNKKLGVSLVNYLTFI
jgi:GNAT superfamily N-acetyltransferase